MLKIITKKSLSVLALLAVGGCNFQSTFNFLDHPFEKDGGAAYDAPIKMPNSVVVCRSKQCAAAKLSMSREYIYNSLLHLFDNNNHKTALICAANPGSHTCTETFITMPITVGITPAYAYIDAVKITDVSVGSGTTKLGLVLNYNVTYNGLLHLFDNNNHKTALICAANPGSHTCTETFITMPITVGITPAYAYIDAVKITDVSVGSGTTKLGLVLNYNVTYNGQTPSCVPAKSLMYVKNVNNIILEDAGYNCKMTTIGQTTIKTLFAIDYIDLDYGFIGGYYSIGFSGPAYGGGSGYMMIRLPKDAYPLAPELRQPESAGRSVSSLLNGTAAAPAVTEEKVEMNTNVQIFPLNKK